MTGLAALCRVCVLKTPGGGTASGPAPVCLSNTVRNRRARYIPAFGRPIFAAYPPAGGTPAPREAPKRGVIELQCTRVGLVPHAKAQMILAFHPFRRYHLMPMDTGPGRDVLHHPRVGRQNLKQFTRLQLANGILGTDHGNRTEQPARIKLVHARVIAGLAHRYQPSGSSSLLIGATVSCRATPPLSTISTSMAGAVRPWL